MKPLININYESEIPLIGAIMFGLIDRGTNLIQIRPTTICPLNCIFCSTDAGPCSLRRRTDYLVEKEYLLDYLKEVINFKGEHNIEANIDSVGEPLTHPKIVEIIHEISQMKGVETISMQSNGMLLTEKLIDNLADAGLTRLNLSMNSLDEDLGIKLSNTKQYSAKRIAELAQCVSNTKINLLIAPVWIPGFNDAEIPKLIEFAKEINKNKKPKYPIIGIQKYEDYKLGRRPKTKEINWWKFFNQLKEWEKQYNLNLILKREDFGIHKREHLPLKFQKGDKISAVVKAQGWMDNQMIAVAENRAVTILGNPPVNTQVRAKIIHNKDNLYVAELKAAKHDLSYLT